MGSTANWAKNRWLSPYLPPNQLAQVTLVTPGAALSRLASETLGQLVDPAQARDQLPALIPSAAKVIPIDTNRPLWDAPLALILFVFLITSEWVLRKVYGML